LCAGDMVVCWFVLCGFGVEDVLDLGGGDGWLCFLGFVVECVVDVLVDCGGVDEVVDGGGFGLADSVDSGAGLVVFGGGPGCFEEEEVVGGGEGVSVCGCVY